jgi:uncharacterized membrane protein YccC
MSPTPERRPRERPTGIGAFAPIIVAVCAIVLVREGMAALFPDLNTWVAFVVALVVGWLAYTGVERWYARRNGGNGPAGQD